jgi:hypothetical protein
MRIHPSGVNRAIKLQDLRAGELLELRRGPVRQRFAPRENDTQRTQVVIATSRMRHQHRQLRADTTQYGDLVAGDRLTHRRRGEPRQDHRGGAEIDRRGVVVHIPKPKGVGMTGKMMSSGVSNPCATAF